MNPSLRQQIVSSAELLLSRPSSHEELPAALRTIGALSRVAQGDDARDDQGDDEVGGEGNDPRDEAGGSTLVDRADALLVRCASELAPLYASTIAAAKLPPLEAVHRWLSAPWGAFTHVVDALDEAGAVVAGLEVIAPEAERTQVLLGELALVASAIEKTARRDGGVMVDAAMAAASRIADRGVAPGPDAALMSLSDVLGQRIEASLRGEPIDVPSPVRARSLDQDQAAHLCAMLSTALRTPELTVSPDLVEMAWSRTMSRGMDVVLHGEPAELVPSLPETEVAPTIHAQFVGTELVVRFEIAPNRGVFLVPLRDGRAGTALRPRTGTHEAQVVFDLHTDQNAEALALVVGDLVVLIRRS